MTTGDDFQDTLEKLAKQVSDDGAQQQENLKAQFEAWQAERFSLDKETVVLRRWTVKEYDAMLEKEILTEKDRVELVNGQIVQMSPQNPPHTSATKRSYDYLKSILSGQAEIRSQATVILNDDSKPEPDIAVVRLDEKEYSDRHPKVEDIFLIIEISDATLTYDLNEKALAYAKSGIEDYWVVDVRLRQVYILRQPVDGVYMQRKVFKLIGAESQETPLLFPNVKVYLLQLLPLNS